MLTFDLFASIIRALRTSMLFFPNQWLLRRAERTTRDFGDSSKKKEKRHLYVQRKHGLSIYR